MARIQQIEELVQEAKSMPLSSSVLVNREEMLELLEAARGELPEEIKQARWVVKDREELLGKARRDADGIQQKAMTERTRIVSQQEVVRVAKEEAERIVAEARELARQIRLEAEDFVHAAWVDRLAEAAHLSPGAFRQRFEYLGAGAPVSAVR